MNTQKVVVVGGGPAGMMAAGTAGRRGCAVTLLEKNMRLGRKLLITGKGRCNLTNMMDVEGIIANIPVNGKFLYSALYRFSNREVVAFFQDWGLPTKVERGGRVFPVSDRSVDVVRALEKYMDHSQVQVMTGEATGILVDGSAVSGVQLKDGRRIPADRVIIATGGRSYPLTGSTGDGYRFAAVLGHTITPLKPALVPLESSTPWIREVQGLALKNVAIKVLNNAGKTIYTDFGELLFTHFGVSGPIILSASTHLEQADSYRLLIDLKPALTPEQLDLRLQRDFMKNGRKVFHNALTELLPRTLIPVMVELAAVDPDKPVNQINKVERQRLAALLKELALDITGLRPIAEAIVTAGGVAINEIDPTTMESKLVKGLFFAGEVIDVNAYTGGFNLQIAFSTGHLAGNSC
ncbi:MAG TPA: aminoacetone oxidase family FAD-binding enzyme [Firmicutes bacterium]|nr:aminoacetone oxidase family FAD-binding enzyme [Bacillota bacterium]